MFFRGNYFDMFQCCPLERRSHELRCLRHVTLVFGKRADARDTQKLQQFLEKTILVLCNKLVNNRGQTKFLRFKYTDAVYVARIEKTPRLSPAHWRSAVVALGRLEKSGVRLSNPGRGTAKQSRQWSIHEGWETRATRAETTPCAAHARLSNGPRRMAQWPKFGNATMPCFPTRSISRSTFSG